MTKALFTATLVLGWLLLGTAVATAAPPAGPTDVATPVAPPDPHPCRPGPVACDLTLAPVTDAPGTTEPSEPAEPSSEPTSEPAEPSSEQPSEHPSEPAESPELAANPPRPAAPGPGAVSPADTSAPIDATWWLIAVPVIALLALAAAGVALLIQRTERRPS